VLLSLSLSLFDGEACADVAYACTCTGMVPALKEHHIIPIFLVKPAKEAARCRGDGSFSLNVLTACASRLLTACAGRPPVCCFELNTARAVQKLFGMCFVETSGMHQDNRTSDAALGGSTVTCSVFRLQRSAGYAAGSASFSSPLNAACPKFFSSAGDAVWQGSSNFGTTTSGGVDEVHLLLRWLVVPGSLDEVHLLLRWLVVAGSVD
jgi:hypothetical protein